MEGLCDLKTEVERSAKEHRVEVFCNAAAAACLIPRSALLNHRLVGDHPNSPLWKDAEIDHLARFFSTSREALLRRLLTFKLTSKAFYEEKRAEYQEQYASHPAKGGYVPPSTDALSLLGRPFVRLVLGSLQTGRITTSDASDYLGIRLKHLPALTTSVEGA
jgi:Zn-dependent peptidase ImmA (M78 family)